MQDATDLKRGDCCPACGGDLKRARVPTADQRKRAEDREARQVLPNDMDNAPEAQRQQLGELFRCVQCRYTTRFPFEENDGTGEGAAEGGARPPANGRTGRQGAPAPRT